jgi:hypothetical protein
MMVFCLFFRFVGQFNFGCCSLAHYLPCFRNSLLPTWSQPSCLSCVCLLIVCAEISSLLSPFLQCIQCTFSVPAPSSVMLDYSLLFVI